MQKIIILRGAPASGKTTLAKSFRDFEEKVAWLKVDNFKDFFSEDNPISLPYVNGSAIAVLKYLINEGFTVVIDGVFQDITAINEAFIVAKDKNIEIKAFELGASLKTLKNRDRTREGIKEGLRKPLGDETIEEIYNTLEENPYPYAIKLDTENNTLEKCKEIINSHFAN